MKDRRSPVFGIGLSRTGTTSLTEALSILGYTACHFPDDADTKVEITHYLREPTAQLHLSILDRANALCDTPVCCTYQALDRTYHDARFILTTRSKPTWLASCAAYWQNVLGPLLLTMEHSDAEYVSLINRTLYGSEALDVHGFSATYDRYQADVAKHFQGRDDFLIMDVCAGDGWSTLCRFLGAPVPDVAFPHANAAVSYPGARS